MDAIDKQDFKLIEKYIDETFGPITLRRYRAHITKKTLRDEFALAAMNKVGGGLISAKSLAKDSYRFADNMIEAREGLISDD